MLDNKFVPNSPYERYIPKDLNFESACYASAVMKKTFHTYIHPERYSFWVDMYMMPIVSDKPNIYYCTYSQELTPETNTKRMSNVDSSVSISVLETCIKLRGTDDFKHTPFFAALFFQFSAVPCHLIRHPGFCHILFLFYKFWAYTKIILLFRHVPCYFHNNML